MSIAKETYRQEGMKGLFAGIGVATVKCFQWFALIIKQIGSGPAFAIFFTSYEFAKIACTNHRVYLF